MAGFFKLTNRMDNDMSTVITDDKVPSELSELSELSEVAFKTYRQGLYKLKQVSPMKWAYEWLNPCTQKASFGYTRERNGFKAFGFCHKNLNAEIKGGKSW